jgi:hypothetical protein
MMHWPFAHYETCLVRSTSGLGELGINSSISPIGDNFGSFTSSSQENKRIGGVNN